MTSYAEIIDGRTTHYAIWDSINENTGAMVKRLHLGRAAESGVLAASLAADGFTGPVTALACRPDGQMAASGSRDNTVRLWSLTDGQPGAVFAGHRHANHFFGCVENLSHAEPLAISEVILPRFPAAP